MIKRAIEAGRVEIRAVNPRDFATDKHRAVDDKPFGGGPGMLMMPEPVDAAIASLNATDATYVMPDPTGRLFRQEDARRLSQAGHLVIVCGHYEGIDDRIRQKWQAEPVSLGDFVLTGTCPR